MGVLNIGVREDGKPFTLPEEFVRSRYAIIAASGYGKTIAWTKMAEQLLHLNQLFMALDVVGNGWGLRVGLNDRPGFPVLVVGGRKGDMTLYPDQGKRYAHAFTSNPIPVVIDLSTTALDDRWKFTADFCSELLMIQPEQNWHVFFEELKELASQLPRNKWHRKSTDAIDSFCTMGRNYGYGYTVVGQRTAIMAKGPLNQAQALFAMHLQGTTDIASLMDWIENNGPDLEQFGGKKALQKMLAKLKKGEAFFVDPSAPEPMVRVQIGRRETIHPAEVMRTNPKLLKNVQMTDVNSFVRNFSEIGREVTKTSVPVPDPGPRKARVPRMPTIPTDEFARMTAENTQLRDKVQKLQEDLSAARRDGQDAERRMSAVREALRGQYDALRGLFEQAPEGGAIPVQDHGRFKTFIDNAPKEGIRVMLRYLLDHGQATRRQLATIANVTSRTAYEYILWMTKNDLVEPEGKQTILLRK